ncbi:Protein argonaute 4B, partial [Mucuna pruriens]
AYQLLGEVNVPKFTVIVAQKNHHTKLFLTNAAENGTSRPVHYHVLLDEIGFSADGLQNLIHSLSYVYAFSLLFMTLFDLPRNCPSWNQRSTFATSVVAPICYAHHAAAQMGQLLNFDDLSETSSTPASEGNIPIPELPRLHKNVRNT